MTGAIHKLAELNRYKQQRSGEKCALIDLLLLLEVTKINSQVNLDPIYIVSGTRDHPPPRDNITARLYDKKLARLTE